MKQSRLKVFARLIQSVVADTWNAIKRPFEFSAIVKAPIVPHCNDGSFAYRLDVRNDRSPGLAGLALSTSSLLPINRLVRRLMLTPAVIIGRTRQYYGKGWIKSALFIIGIWALFLSSVRFYHLLNGYPLHLWWQGHAGMLWPDAILGWLGSLIVLTVDKSIEYGSIIIALYGVFIILWAIWRTRNNVEIKEFSGTSPEKPKIDTAGINDLLIVEMGRLRKLYLAVDERQPVSSGSGIAASGPEATMDVLFKVEDVSDFLNSVFTEDSVLTIAGYKMPIGSILALIKKAVQGSEISGNIYYDNCTLVLAAQYSGAKIHYSWLVSRVFPEKYDIDRQSAIVIEMVRELACQMFSDMVLGSSVRSKAVSKFCEGLVQYRDSLSTSENIKSKLLDAEAKFKEAYSIDTTYHIVHHNLGVVYWAMDREDLAMQSFADSIRLNPSHLEARYGLALMQFKQNRYDEAIKLCNSIISARKSNLGILARTYDLKASVIVKMGRTGSFCDAMACREKALYASWLSLCLANASGNSIEQSMDVYRSSLLNLANNYYEIALQKDHGTAVQASGFRRAKALYLEALSLPGPSHSLHFELGQLYVDWGSYQAAATEFERAIRSSPDNPKYWAYYAYACAHLCCPDASFESIYEAAARVREYSLASVGRGRDFADAREALEMMILTYNRLMYICQ